MLQAQRSDGSPVEIGETITSFRGEKWIYLGPTRVRVPGRSGKVRARPIRGDRSIEFYDGVFSLIVVDV